MILIDTTFLSFGKTGIGTVINQILNIFQKEHIEYKQISYFDYYSEKSKRNWYYYFNKILFSEIKKLSKDDIFLFPENLGGILRTANFKCKSVFIILDLFELKSKSKFLYWVKKQRFSHVLKNVTKIITISNFCKLDIGTVFPFLKTRLSIVYPFYIEQESIKELDRQNETVFSDSIQNYLSSGKYILANGSGQERKNAEFLIKNAEKLYNDFGLKLVLFGKDFYNNNYKNIYDSIDYYNVEKHIIHLGSLTDEQLNYAYKHAACFVFPSSDEGFGLPPVEALLSFCRIAVSDIAIFREVLSPLNRFFAFDYESLAENINKVLIQSEEDFYKERDSILEKFKYSNYKNNLFSILDIHE